MGFPGVSDVERDFFPQLHQSEGAESDSLGHGPMANQTGRYQDMPNAVSETH